MTVRTRSLAAGLGLLLLSAALAACATPVGSGPGPAATTGGTPSGTPGGASTDIEVDAAWLDGGRMIGIVTQGSSSCVPTAGEVTYDAGVLDVEFVEFADPSGVTACTDDLSPRVTLVGLPEGVDPTQDLQIRVTGDGYRGDDDLGGVPGLAAGGETDYLPSAGWTGADGQFVLLTWGSSTCRPVIENVAPSAPAEVTVTFATPPADQVCTMDMAPRGTVAQVTGLEEDSGVVAVLTGSPEFDGVRVPIVGSD